VLLCFILFTVISLSPGQTSDWILVGPGYETASAIRYRWSRPTVNSCDVEFRTKTSKSAKFRAEIKYLAHGTNKQSVSSATGLIELPRSNYVHVTDCEAVQGVMVSGSNPQ
jgi:hypothetical protein